MIVADDTDIIDRATFRALRAETGAGFGRILSYFREDGIKSVDAIETGIAMRNAAVMVLPAHTLKGESLQFGAIRLAALAERIEEAARDCVEAQRSPAALAEDAAALRPLFERTLAVLQPPTPTAASTAARPAPPRPPAGPAGAAGGRPVFGRRTGFGTAIR